MSKRLVRLFIGVITTAGVLTLPVTPVAAANEPNTPVVSLVSATGNSIRIGWTAPATNGLPITRYELRRGATLVSSSITASTVTFTNSGLSAGTEYSFTVKACSTGGCSEASTPLVASTLPAAALNVAGAAGEGSVTVTWTDSVSASLTGHKVSYRLSTASTWIEWTPGVVDTSPTTVTGLSNASSYVFKVAAFNNSGATDSKVSRTVIPRTVPSAPVISTSTISGVGVGLTWAAPAGNGAAVSSYKIYRDGVQIGTNGTSTRYTASGLTAGTQYAFHVEACNVAGCSAQSNILSVPTKAAATTSITAEPGDTTLTVSWTASVSPVVSGYRLWYKTSSASTWTEWTPGTLDSSPTTVTGLTNGTAYVFKLASVNDSGEIESRNSPSFTPRTLPGVPVVSVTGVTSGSIAIAWPSPDTGGNKITGYQVYVDGVLNQTVTSAKASLLSLSSATSYAIRVKACNASGCSNLSTQITQATKPLAVTPVATRSDREVTVTWNEASGTITRYDLYYKVATSPTWILWTPETGDTSPTAVTGLTNGVAYNFKVNTINSAADIESRSASATPIGVPPVAPAQPGAASITSTGAAISWVIPANTGGISANGFQIWVNGLLTATTMSSARAYNLTGLTPGDIATVQVKVCNTAGCSPASTTRNVTTAPPAPGSLSSNPAQESIEIFWTDADAPVITGHRIYYRLTGAPSWTLHETRLTSEASVPEIVFNGLTAKTSYQFKVVAYNVTGEASTTVHTVETLSYQLPGAPTGVLAAPGNGALSVSWTAPTDRGGDSGALYFYATASIGAIVHGSCSATEPSTGCEITGLTNGTEYVVRVTAANDAGTGAASESNLSSIATPRTVPSQITDLAGSSGDEQVTLTWSAPADGGAPIVSYRIEYHDGDGVWELHGNPSSANVVIDGSASYVVNALTNGTTYSFRISAVNDAGWGTVSGTYTTTPTGGETPAQTTAASLWNEIVNRNSIVYDEKVAFVYRPNGCITTAWYGSSWSASESESDCTNSGGTWYPAAAVMVVDGPDADTYVSSYPTAYLAGGTEVATALDPGSQTPEEFATDVRVALAAHALANGAQQINFNNGNVYFLSASGDYNSYTNDGLTDYSITMAYEPLYDMYKAGKPETPSGVTVDTSDGVTVSWTQATGTGQVAGGMYSQIWGYQVTASPGGGTCSTSANSTSCKVNGLTPGETYTFTVKTGAYGGYSDPSTPTGAIVAPAAVAATAPREISIYSAGWTETGSVQMYWSAPLWDGGSAVTDYVIEYSDDNGDSWTTANDGVSTDANKVLGGFTPGNTYKFRLRAVTSVGNGAASSPITVTIFRPIEAPTSVTATPADGSVTVSWTAPSYGTPVNYNVQYSSDGGSSWTTFSDNWDANTTTTVTGLTNGTEYLFRVNAVDNESTSAWSTSSLAVAPVFSWPNGTPQVGDTGPGGGKVFYVSETPFACGANLASTCTYLEAAPIAGWYLQGYMVRSWSSNTSTDVSGADGTAIGTGYQNSVDIANQSGNTHLNSAAVKARAYTSNGFSDWFLPSKDELNQLYLQRATVGYAEAMYWSSSEVNATTAWTQEVGGNGNQMSWYNKYQTYVAHPVRAG